MVIFYDKWVDRIRLLLQLHDGMYISYPKSERAMWLTRLRKCMEMNIEINGRTIMIDIEMKAGPNWGDLKDVNF